MKRLTERAKHRSLLGPVVCVRLLLNWLLVTVLALDLAGSPLHAHRHDVGFSSAATVSASAGHHEGAAGAHVDHDDGTAFSHSITALRGDATSLPDAPSGPWGSAALFPVSNTAAKEVAVRQPWPPDQHRAGSSAFRSLPPDGRAPPLHA